MAVVAKVQYSTSRLNVETVYARAYSINKIIVS
jgi:hypothetical protein